MDNPPVRPSYGPKRRTISLRNGWPLFGVLFGLLALMALQVARTTRRRAAELAAKIQLLEREG